MTRRSLACTFLWDLISPNIYSTQKEIDKMPERESEWKIKQVYYKAQTITILNSVFQKSSCYASITNATTQMECISLSLG